MKKAHWIIACTTIVAIGAIIGLNYLGYHRIPVDGGTLYGRAMGRNKDTVVLLVAGSGPTDMDGNTPVINGKNNSLLYLARDLSRQGIATFRYDKRSAGRSRETFDLTNIEFDTFVNDCIAVVRHLRNSGYKRIVIAGHSKGSLVAMLAAAGEPVDGLVSIAGTGHPIDITLERQLLNLYPADSAEIRLIHSLREGKTDPTPNVQFDVSMQEFLLTWMKYHPAEILRNMTIPTLVIQGDKDVQADMQDFQAFEPVSSLTQTLVIPNMNHVLKRVENDKENTASYSDPSYPLHEDLVPAMVNFINTSVGR